MARKEPTKIKVAKKLSQTDWMYTMRMVTELKGHMRKAMYSLRDDFNPFTTFYHVERAFYLLKHLSSTLGMPDVPDIVEERLAERPRC